MRTAIFLLLLICTVGCTSDNDEDQKTNNEFNLYWNESNGWISYSYELKVSHDGLMTINEIISHPQHLERTAGYQISAEELEAVRQDLFCLLRINLKNYGYGTNPPTDLPTRFFKYNYGCVKDSSLIYFPDEGEIPYELQHTLNKINSLIVKYDSKYKITYKEMNNIFKTHFDIFCRQ